MDSSTTSVRRWDIERRVVRYPEYFARRYRQAGAWSNLTVGESFHEAALRYRDREAAVSPEGRMTYERLDRESDLFGAALLRRGLEPGDRVLFHMANVLETVVAYYGVLKAGLVPVCAIPQHRGREMRHLARLSGARAYLVQADYPSQDLQGLAAEVAADSPAIEHVIVARGEPRSGLSMEGMMGAEDPARSRRELEALGLDAEAVGVLQLSGGTTGVPKLIPRLHCEYAYNSRQLARARGLDEEAVIMHAGPLMHNAGIAAAMQPCHFVGAKFVLAPALKPDALLSLIGAEGVHGLIVTPGVLQRLLELGPRPELSSLTHLVVSGQKLRPELAGRAEAALGILCPQLFGMAEGMFLYPPADAPDWVRKNTIGAPISPLDEVRILDPDGEREVPPGELGELCCRGPYTIRGYFGAPEHDASAFTSDGFFRTGDVARAHLVAGEAYYSVEGRLKDLINRGGEKINAEEVEGLLGEHPAVRAAVLVAMPDRDLGERACAYLIPETGAEAPNLDDVRAFLLDRGMAKFKFPERLEVVDEFPLSNVGKLSKKHLREDVARKLEEEGAWTPSR